MKTNTTLVIRVSILLATLSAPLGAQEPTPQERERREKIESILRAQDLRLPADTTLLKAFRDPDPVVRERAALAAASLQDTTLLPHLTPLLGDPLVSSAAAFAIGQTATMLSPASQRRWEADLLATTTGQTTDRASLLDGMGKFCSGAGLDRMLQAFESSKDSGIVRGLISAAGRSAIRGVTTDRAVRFLLHETHPIEKTPWMVVYAMQRIGPHPEILREFDRLRPLRTHPDPLARMHYATLLGKLASRYDVRPLLSQMAERDADPRVRINALRSLSAVRDFDPGIFRRALSAPEQQIQLVAVQGVSGARWLADTPSPESRQLLRDLEDLARNVSGGSHWQVQAEAMLALARLQGMIFHLPTRAEQRPYELRAIAVVKPTTAMVTFEQEVQNGEPAGAVAALEGALALVHGQPADTSLRSRTRSLATDALKRNDVAITATAATLLADSLLLTGDSVPVLLDALDRQSLNDDLEGILAILEALGRTRDTRAVPTLEKRLTSPEPAVTQAAVRALRSITGKDYSGQASVHSTPLYAEVDFQRLWSLPDTVRMTLATSRGPVRIELYPRDAPFTVMSFLRLAETRKFFDSLTFHRVVPNFVVQGGDPRGDGWGGPGYTIRSEFAPKNFETGSIGMASAGKDTEGSQFFITHSPQPHLDGRYTVFGRVASGQQVVDRLMVGDTILTIRSGW